MDKQAKLERIRHSLSHLMSMAIMEKYPQAGLGVGPSIENGFYQDYDLPESLSETDFGWIEKRMRGMIHKKIDFKQSDSDFASALKFYKHDPYKTEMIKDLKAKGEKKLSFYDSDQFHNLCAGPHVENTSEINTGAFKIMSVAGAYWRGDEKNKILTRHYGVAFETNEELDDYLTQLEEATKRDHRKLGQELDLFAFDDEVGPGLPLWLPKGAYLRNAIMEFAFNTYLKNGYDPVVSPHIASAKLWGHSGHLDFYAENMYGPMMIEGEEYRIKPMNCPFHVKMYKSRMHSYRELPCRWTEMGTVYRYERSGVLHGLTRVRGFTQDDAHIICRPDQLKEEIEKALKLTLFILNTFGFKDFEMNVSVRDPENKTKFIGEDER